MTLQELGPTAAEVQTLRTELDELLRARQFAAQRERRLAEAVRTAGEPGRVGGYGVPPQQPDPELLRQLSQAQTLREGLGARCLELSDRLLAMEDQILAERISAGRPEAGRLGAADGRPSSGTGRHPSDTQSYPTAAADRSAAAGRAAAPTGPVPPARRRPTGARFGGAYQEAPEPTLPTIEAPPMRGARFGGIKATPGSAGTGTSTAASPTSTAPTTASPTTDRSGNDRANAGRSEFGHTNPGHSNPGHSNPRQAGPARTVPSQGHAATATQTGHPQQPEPRAHAGLTNLADLARRITELHRRGSAQESAAVVAQAAVTLNPSEVANLAAMLRTGGPVGSAGYLARSVAYGAAEQAADTLAELRRTGLIDEAADLFHALWSVPAGTLPALLAALERAGQSADGQTLLWEWASAPPGELTDLATQLLAAGRSADVRSLLRQAAGRPIGEVAQVAEALDRGMAPGLVAEVVRLRSAVDVGAFAAAIRGDGELYTALLTAVTALDESRSRAALAALRSTGLPTEPPTRSRSRR